MNPTSSTGIPTIPTQVSEPKQQSTSKVLVVVVVFLFVLFVGMLGYLGYSYMNKQQTANSVVPTPVNNQRLMVTVTPSPVPLQTSDEVNALDIGSVEGDLKDINTDLQNLQ